MASRRGASSAWRGRTVVALALLAFVATAVIVVWRRTRGYAEVQRIAELDLQRRDLEARRALLERDLRDATSSARIVPAAERRLGLRRATDSQLVTLSRGAGSEPVNDSL